MYLGMLPEFLTGIFADLRVGIPSAVNSSTNGENLM